MVLPIFSEGFLQAQIDNSTWLPGVNYGNRFIPEPWMADDSYSIYGTKYGPAVQKASNVKEVSFCDVTDDRILRWLDDNVKEEHFAQM